MSELFKDSIRVYAAQHGLTDLPDEQLVRLVEMARRAGDTGRAVPRQASKWTEPAGIFRVADISRL